MKIYHLLFCVILTLSHLVFAQPTEPYPVRGGCLQSNGICQNFFGGSYYSFKMTDICADTVVKSCARDKHVGSCWTNSMEYKIEEVYSLPNWRTDEAKTSCASRGGFEEAAKFHCRSSNEFCISYTGTGYTPSDATSTCSSLGAKVTSSCQNLAQVGRCRIGRGKSSDHQIYYGVQSYNLESSVSDCTAAKGVYHLATLGSCSDPFDDFCDDYSGGYKQVTPSICQKKHQQFQPRSCPATSRVGICQLNTQPERARTYYRTNWNAGTAKRDCLRRRGKFMEP